LLPSIASSTRHW